MNGHNGQRKEIEVLRACISWVGAANLRISESPDLTTVLREALEPLGQAVRQFPPLGVKAVSSHPRATERHPAARLGGACFQPSQRCSLRGRSPRRCG